MNEDVTNLRQAIAQILAGHRMIVTQQGTRACVMADPKTGEPDRINPLRAVLAGSGHMPDAAARGRRPAEAPGVPPCPEHAPPTGRVRASPTNGDVRHARWCQPHPPRHRCEAKGSGNDAPKSAFTPE